VVNIKIRQDTMVLLWLCPSHCLDENNISNKKNFIGVRPVLTVLVYQFPLNVVHFFCCDGIWFFLHIFRLLFCFFQLSRKNFFRPTKCGYVKHLKKNQIQSTTDKIVVVTARNGSIMFDSALLKLDRFLNDNISLHPGHFFFSGGFFLSYAAFASFNESLEVVIGKELVRQLKHVPKIKGEDIATSLSTPQNLDDATKRIMASTIATRAFRVATFGTTGFMFLGMSAFCYMNGWKSMDEALSGINMLTKRRIRHHPDYIATQNMSEEEEHEYISKTFFPESDGWSSEDE
jgi:hypothetical protein